MEKTIPTCQKNDKSEVLIHIENTFLWLLEMY